MMLSQSLVLLLRSTGANVYKIVGVNVGASKTFNARPINAITGVTTTGFGTAGAGPNNDWCILTN